jgi:hypothetical protein
MPPISMRRTTPQVHGLQDGGGDLVDCSPMPQRYRTEGNLTKQYGRAKILGISFGRVGHEPVAMKANLLVVIPFEKWGGNNSRNFRTVPTSLPTWKPRSLLLVPIPLDLEGGETHR